MVFPHVWGSPAGLRLEHRSRLPARAATAMMTAMATVMMTVMLTGAMTGPGTAATGASTLTPTAAVAARASLPTESEWLQDVAASMQGSRAFLTTRAARGEEGLAIVLDIDNTSLATYYGWPDPVQKTRSFARHAHRLGITVFFATGRLSERLDGVPAVLRRAGYRFRSVCTRRSGESLKQGKVRCRKSFEADGYTIVAMVGNRKTDFAGGHWERAFRLPNYDNQLG